MKKFFLFILTLTLFVACKEDPIAPSNFYLEIREYSEEELFTVGSEQAVYLWSTKAWADNQVSEVKYVIDEQVLQAYNEKNAVNLKLLPDACYRLIASDFKVTDESKNARFKFFVSPEKIIETGGKFEEFEYALPFRILVNGEKKDDNNSTVVVAFKVMRPSVFIDGDTIETIEVTSQEILYPTLNVRLNFRNFWDVTPTFDYSPKMVEEYNTKNNTNYFALAQKAVEWDASDNTFSRGIQNRDFLFSINLDSLKQGTTLVPLSISAVTDGFFIDPKRSKKLIKIIDPRTPQSEWKVVSTSPTKEGKAENLVDKKVENPISSFWTADVSGDYSKPPYWITLKLKNPKKLAWLTGISMFHKQGDLKASGQKIAEIRLSTDSVRWNTVATHEFALDASLKPIQTAQKIEFTRTRARYIQIFITEVYPVPEPEVSFQEIFMLGELVDRP